MRTDDDVITAAAGPARRPRRAAGAVATAVAVAAIGAGAVLLSPGGAGTPAPGGDVPDGRRLVGIGHAAIAVPQAWATNAVRCLTPQRDTVVIDVAGQGFCLPEYPAGVESVWVRQGAPGWADEEVLRDVEIAGVPAKRTGTVCADAYGPGTVCRATVNLPGHDVSFAAASSTGAAEVDEILTWIRVVDDRIAVPGHGSVADDVQDERAAYLEVLRTAGFGAEVVTKKVAGRSGGAVLDTTPAVGTMLAPGTTVTVTVAR